MRNFTVYELRIILLGTHPLSFIISKRHYQRLCRRPTHPYSFNQYSQHHQISAEEGIRNEDLGQVSHILGMHVNYDQPSGHATIDQSGYIARALDDLNLQNVKRRIIPMNTNLHLSIDDGPSSTEEKEEMMSKPYAQAVGKLNWISQASRPDIAYATNVCSRFTQNPGIKHWNAIKQIFGFLKNTIDTKISFSRKSGSIEGFTKGVIKPDNFEGFVDADWAGCSDTNE